VLQHGFELGHQRVVDLQRLHRPQRGFGQQRACCGDRVNGVGLGQPPGPPLRRRPLCGHLAGVESRGDHGDRDMRAPARGPFDPDPGDTVGDQQIDRGDEPAGGVTKRVVGEFDAVGVDDADGELGLVRVYARDGCCHAGVSCRFVEGSGGSGSAGTLRHIRVELTGSLQARSAPAGPTLDATGLTSGTKPGFSRVSTQRRAAP